MILHEIYNEEKSLTLHKEKFIKLQFEYDKLQKKPKFNAIKIKNLKKQMQDLINPEKMFDKLGVDIITIIVSKELHPLVDPDKRGALLPATAMLREKLALNMGYILPIVKIKDASFVDAFGYEIYIREKQVFKDLISESEISSNTPMKIISNLENICYKYVFQIISKKDIINILKIVNAKDSTLINDIIPKYLSIIDIKNILATLIIQKVPINDIFYIFELLNDFARYNQNINDICEKIKQGLNFVH